MVLPVRGTHGVVAAAITISACPKKLPCLPEGRCNDRLVRHASGPRCVREKAGPRSCPSMVSVSPLGRPPRRSRGDDARLPERHGRGCCGTAFPVLTSRAIWTARSSRHVPPAATGLRRSNDPLMMRKRKSHNFSNRLIAAMMDVSVQRDAQLLQTEPHCGESSTSSHGRVCPAPSNG